jgi:hypothetical protein
MSLKNTGDGLMMENSESLEGTLKEAEIGIESRNFESALIDVLNEVSKNCVGSAFVYCSLQADLANKIAENVDRTRYELLASPT